MDSRNFTIIMHVQSLTADHAATVLHVDLRAHILWSENSSEFALKVI